MCGIIGWVGFGDAPPLPVEALRHRGPDDGDLRVCESRHGAARAALGSRRLSVIDPSPAGRMPMAYPGEPIALTYDGEAYNSRELRAELRRLGEQFSSRTDTEVALRGYRHWGDRVVERLRGMFALALWDGRGEGRLLLARDRFGQKPLYWRECPDGSLLFASELKAMLSVGSPREVDPECLDYYLDRGCPPPDRCILSGFRKLPPGHLLVWEDGRVRQACYWRPPSPTDGRGTRISSRAVARELADRLREAVRLRLVADVPAGALLSGGPASASVLACMAEAHTGPLRTYTACFGAPGLDEAERARRTARRLGSRHRAIMISPRSGRLLPFIASHMDEPIADPSAIAIYLICRRAREEVTVLLTGHGSDELLFAHDVETWLSEDPLTGLDRMSMANSVRARLPFLDPDLAGWLLQLPVSAKTSWRRGQAALREAMGGVLPDTIARRGKQALRQTVDEWLRSEWRPLVQDVLLDRATLERGWTDEAEVRRMVREHVSGRARHGRRLYLLLVLELWARAILDRGRAEEAPADVGDCARELPADRPVRRVAVIAPAGIGDTVRLTPGVRELAERDAAVSVTLYVDADRGSDQVMAGWASVDRHVPVSFRGRLSRRLGALLGDLRRTRPDLLVSTWVSHLAGPVGWLSGVRDRSGWAPQWSRPMRAAGSLWSRPVPYDPPCRGAGDYDIERFCQALGLESADGRGLSFAPPIWEGESLVRARRAMDELARPLLAVGAAAAATLPQREYPLERMARAIEMLLAEEHVGAVLLLGDGESAARMAPLRRASRGRGLDLCGALDMAGTAAVMRECDAALVVDGGLLHVALATELPVVAVCGPTEVFTQDPRGGDGRYRLVSAFDRCTCRCVPHRGFHGQDACRKEAACLAALPPERVAEAVAALLARPAVLSGAGSA